MVREANREMYEAVIIACFGDPAIDAAKEVSEALVLGITEVSLHLAALLGHRFSIISSLKTIVPAYEQYARRLGLQHRLASVRPLNMTVLEAEAAPDECRMRMLALGRQAIDDGVEVLVLGCAGWVGYSDQLSRQLGIPVVDPTSVTLKAAEALVESGLRHSKRGLFAKPLGLRDQ